MARRKKAEKAYDPLDPHMVLARERFLSASEDSTQRKEWQIDRDFKALKQWDSVIENARKAQQRPILTFDQVGPALRQVCNQQRSASPSLKMIPRRDATQKKAMVFEGVVRLLQDVCHAQLSYDWSFEEGASIGLGWLKLRSEYESDQSDDQKVIIDTVLNAMAVFPDPAAQHRTFRDMRFLFEIKDLPKGEYKHLYPDSSVTSLEEWDAIGVAFPDWFPEKRIRVAHYWYVKEQAYEADLYPDGKYYALDKAPEGQASLKQPRRMVDRTICCDTINGVEVLEHNEWPGKFIPYIPVIGEEYFYEGRRCFRGIYRAARDAQRTYNYERTSLTEKIALSKAPDYVADADQIEPYKDIWEQRTVRNLGYLPYKAKSVDGHLLPPPQLNTHDPAIEATVVAINLAKQDLRSTTSWYDPTDPSRKNTDQSGKAIRARFEETTVGNSHYLDNFTQISLRYLGELLIDVIPKFYDRKGRIMRIVDDADTPQTIMLGMPFRNGPDGEPIPAQEGDQDAEFYDLSVGEYDVAVTVGGSTSTRRQEFVENGFRLMEALPAQAPAFADVVVEKMDDAGSRQIAARLKKMLPPQLQEQDGKQDPQMQIQKLTQQLQQMGQMLDLTTKELDKRVEMIQNETVKAETQIEIKRIETASREAIEQAKIRLEVYKVQATIEAQKASENLAALQAELDSLGAQSHEKSMLNRQQDHERQMSQESHDQALEQQAQQGQIGMEQQAQQGEIGMAQAEQQAELAPPEAEA